MEDQTKVPDEALSETLSPGQAGNEPIDIPQSSTNILSKSAPIAQGEDLDLTLDQPSVAVLSQSLQTQAPAPQITDIVEGGSHNLLSDPNRSQHQPTDSNDDGSVNLSSDKSPPQPETAQSGLPTPSNLASLDLAMSAGGDMDEQTRVIGLTDQAHNQTKTPQATSSTSQTSTQATKIPQPIPTKRSVPDTKLIQTDVPANQSDKNSQPANLKQQQKGEKGQEKEMSFSQEEKSTDSIHTTQPKNQSSPKQRLTTETPLANRTTEVPHATNQPTTSPYQPKLQANLQPASSDRLAGDQASGHKISPPSEKSSADCKLKATSLPDTIIPESQSVVTLFFTYKSYYSQKVLLCLYEREIPFKERMVNIHADENLEPWYVALNPRAEVPMIQIGERYITDSEVIINYLGRMPISRGTTLVGDNRTPSGQLIQRYRRLIGGVNMHLLTYGVVHHPYLTKGDINLPKLFQQFMKAYASSKLAILSDLSKKYPDQRNIYVALSETHAQRYEMYIDAEAVSKEIEHVGEILASLEEQLARTKPDITDTEWWLCGEDFTAADISMIVLINRLHLLGLDCDFFGEELPLVQQYFKRASQRPSYKTLMERSGRNSIFKQVLLHTTKRALPYIGGATAMGIAAGIALWLYRKAR